MNIHYKTYLMEDQFITNDIKKRLPVFYQFSRSISLQKVKEAQKEKMKDFVAIRELNTTAFMVFSHHKPISKIVKF